ncbi:TMEM43 family protein [Ectothiorhodospira shaposhnikovii]|uniref:TMEM43 family protein n=1 Tax=Ectothiorhodospira shaposhnikovii TaxID=1054 RepID=UPI001EE895D4|nr:TMEM43 family protein [Ectothiorhodospira shaposhnikovii]MCG5514482.1 TMEM43 family protein [Ectothiorhodospira shaposhnikovii]
MNSNVVITRRNVFQRLGDSIKGILVGLLLIAISFPVLFLNEGRAVKTAKSLQEGAAAVVSVSADIVDPAHEGALVHVIATVEVDEALTDDIFGIMAHSATGLKRTVEMFQWREDSTTQTRTSVGGTEERVTTYSYRQEWSSNLIRSSSFNDPSHRNPTEMPYPEMTLHPSTAGFGAFQLTSAHLTRFTSFQPIHLTDEHLDALPASAGAGFRIHNGALFRGADPASPAVGDVRITFSQAPAGAATVVGRQTGDSFTAYPTQAGRPLLFVRSGVAAADEVFSDAMAANTFLTWILRFVGGLLMFLGLTMVLKPLSVLASVLPMAGRIVATGTGIVAFIISASVSLVVIAIAWIVYRPLFGIGLLVLAGGIALGLKTVWKKAPGAAVPSPAPASGGTEPPPPL